ncbi:MAG: chemotaxis protein CheW [Chromatiaceae bacterium]|nr:chemotaxis protein CheW [Chromatiaceae bacterium]
MIRVHGVNLAVPLDRLDTIARWNGESTPIPGQPRWQIGLFLHERKKVSLVNLSRLIMPERQMTDSPPPGYLLLIGGARWGVVCDSIQRPRLLRAEEVRWSRNRQIRPWSHGIVVESLSVLLNIDALLAAIGTNNA